MLGHGFGRLGSRKGWMEWDWRLDLVACFIPTKAWTILGIGGTTPNKGSSHVPVTMKQEPMGVLLLFGPQHDPTNPDSPEPPEDSPDWFFRCGWKWPYTHLLEQHGCETLIYIS